MARGAALRPTVSPLAPITAAAILASGLPHPRIEKPVKIERASDGKGEPYEVYVISMSALLVLLV
jgi:hypothetical protein